MNIMAPVSSISSAKLYSKIGVKEIYVGVEALEEHTMHNVTFTGRAKHLDNGGITQLNSFAELEQVVSVCHENGMKVNFTANVRNLSGELNQNYLEYVEKAIEMDVDSLIVGSIGALILLNKKKYRVPLHSSTFFYPFNKQCVDFFRDLNVKRIILPTALTLKEIKVIKDYIAEKKYDIELEVFSHFGCSNINGRCNIFYNPPSICRGKFDVYDDKLNLLAKNYSFLDAGKDCSICCLKTLMEYGIDSVKIMGRGLPISLVGALAQIYQESINNIENGMSVKEVRENVLKKVAWWESSYCNDQRCLYNFTDTAKYYI